MSDKINLINNYTKFIYHIKLVASVTFYKTNKKQTNKQNIITERVQK